MCRLNTSSGRNLRIFSHTTFSALRNSVSCTLSQRVFGSASACLGGRLTPHAIKATCMPVHLAVVTNMHYRVHEYCTCTFIVHISAVRYDQQHSIEFCTVLCIHASTIAACMYHNIMMLYGTKRYVASAQICYLHSLSAQLRLEVEHRWPSVCVHQWWDGVVHVHDCQASTGGHQNIIDGRSHQHSYEL